MDSFISAKNVNFEYGLKRALHDVSFDVRRGAIVALVGPNGAGKTTLMRCMMGLEKPLSGQITIGGTVVEENPRAIHKTCGYLSDFSGCMTR